jgi:hypothetical protein
VRANSARPQPGCQRLGCIGGGHSSSRFVVRGAVAIEKGIEDLEHGLSLAGGQGLKALERKPLAGGVIAG